MYGNYGFTDYVRGDYGNYGGYGGHDDFDREVLKVCEKCGEKAYMATFHETCRDCFLREVKLQP